MHAHTHIHMPTYPYTHIPTSTYTHTYKHKHIYPYTHIHISFIYILIHFISFSSFHLFISLHISFHCIFHRHICLYTQTHTYPHIHIHTYKHIHKYQYTSEFCMLFVATITALGNPTHLHAEGRATNTPFLLFGLASNPASLYICNYCMYQIRIPSVKNNKTVQSPLHLTTLIFQQCH